MASGGSPYDDFKGRKSDHKPKSNRKPPRFGTSFEAELSLNSELQRTENEERRSLPNNLSWTGGEGSRGKKQSKSKGSPGDQYSSDSSPARFTRKKHTPATIPRTKFSTSASETAQHRTMDKLRQHLTFTGEDETPRSEESGSRHLADIRVNNERNNQQQSSSSRGTPQRNQENDSGVNPLQLENATNHPPTDHSRVVNRLKQVRGYLRQATSLYITLSSKSTSPDEATDEDLEQLEKLAKLIKDLKAQEKAYVDFVQRNIAIHGESSLDNTPSTSVVSLDGETQDDAVSEQSEDLEGLRQQHALLRQMVEQQKQLKELQDRQNTLLDLQRRAENQLKEAEAEGRRISSLMNGHAIENGSASGRSRSGTERSDESRSDQPAAVGGTVNRGSSATALRYPSREQAQPERKLSNEQKPENFKNRRLPSEQAAWIAESTGSQTPDNEAQALAAADAAQERLELESKLMDLQAKKEQMDALVGQLQQLREMQLGKEMALSQERNVNETIENGEDDVPLATRSAKDTGDNVDDEKILEALQLHKKLRKLQDVRDKLESLKELFEEQQERSGGESDTIAGVNGPHQAKQSRENQGAESQPRGADGGAISDDMPPGSFDWILNSGIDDPELLTKLRQVKAAKERVANLKQRIEQNNVAQPYGRAEAVAGLAQASAIQDEDSAVQTDNETTGSVSSSLMWQEDPEFQEKLRKLNAARKKLKKLQELVKKTEELPLGPNGRPYLPAEIDEMSFSSEEDDASTATEGAGQDADRDEKESEEDATSETLVQEEANHAHGYFAIRGQEDDGIGDPELDYMDKLTQQRAALSHLLAEKQKLLETQEHLNRLRQSDAVTQTRQSDRLKPLDSFIHNPTEASTSRQGATVDSTTQTLVSSEPRRDKYPQSGTTSNTLLWRELRRQRELQEQKLKKRKERLMLERKGRRSGLENASEDEGFGRSTLSADITTATWGGSTQMSSTQNDSAVSEGSSHDSDEEEEILVEVEDEASDGIVQAEEEEEANSEVDIYPTTSTASRSTGTKRKQNANQKRLLFEGLRKQDLERHERFKGWQNSLFPSGNKMSTKKPQRFSNPEELNEEDRYSARERSMWERQLNVLQGQLENTTSLCNTLLRDQQTLLSFLLNRGETTQPSRFGPNSFSQYQQRQQEALQGIQNYFEQQRFLVQQQQMLQNLTECYSQMQQQHEDMLHLQQSFAQLFTHTSEERTPSARPATAENPSASTLGNSRTPNSFSFQPSTSLSYRPQDSLRETPPPSPFTSTQAKPSVERHVSTAGSSTSQQPSYASMSFPCLPGLRNRQFQFVGSTNPDTGVPSPEASTRGTYNQATGSVKPVSARVVSASNANSENTSLAYNPVTYSVCVDSKASGSSNVVVGKQFPTPVRAAAAAQLAEQDKSNWRGVKRRRQEDKMETDSVSSHQSSLPGDSERPGTESDAQSDYSLFEALRDSIYAEVATLISQNESRPHFLIELFRELQLLGSDYLRQRALYSLRDLVTRFLKDDPPGGTIESAMGPYTWLASGSEQTPSESAGFSETDQDQDKMKVPEISTQGIYDYVEAVDSGSSLSTPNSGNHEPFASEFLGETVIHLDKALKSMRERDRRDSERSSATGNEGATGGGQGEASSAGDVASESSLPDIQYPKIDTQALDRQIKKIMAEVIPCLNDHMEDTCSVELLEYIRKMVMGMVQQKNEAKEFSRFFHKQLESILQDSLAKFIGKRMKDCGEDLLVDISEILFNELAFYKLMQELDGGAKAKFFNREQKYRMENSAARNSRNQEGKKGETSGNTATEMKDEKEVEVENENAEDEGDSSSSSSEWQVVDETPEDKPQDMISREQLEQDEETLGRDRDDAMAEEFDETRNHAEAADTESSQCIKVVELSMSESRPLARDDEEESEVEISGDVDENEDNAEGAVWNGSVNGNHGAHHNTLPSQMAAAEGVEAEDEQGASSGNQNKQEEDQDDDLPTKFTGLTEADLQVKIAEEQSRNDGIHGIVVSMDDGNELAGDPNAIAEPAEGSALVNGDANDAPEN